MKKKKKKTIKKLILIFFLITIGVFLYKSDVFLIDEVIIENNYYLDDDYIYKKSGISKNDKIFSINKKSIERNIEKETYIKNVNIEIKLPDRVVINVEERSGKIVYNYKNNHILLDFDGIILRKVDNTDEYFIIESKVETNNEIGKKLYFKNNSMDIDNILNLSKYIYETNNKYNCKILIKKEDKIYIKSEDETYIKLDKEKDLKYQYEFGCEIINNRVERNQNISGLIDFTKGENPIFINSNDLEEEL